jgi:hypothetical protein
MVSIMPCSGSTQALMSWVGMTRRQLAWLTKTAGALSNGVARKGSQLLEGCDEKDVQIRSFDAVEPASQDHAGVTDDQADVCNRLCPT